jgi:hypothetical protein
MNKARVMTNRVRRLMIRHLVHRSSFIIRHSTRRGVVSVLSMMFLVLFGSLAAAMAIASRGNLQTAASHLHVMRALGAAETGLDIAEARLTEAVSRFVVERGKIDSGLGEALWQGGSVSGDLNVLPLRDGTVPGSIADALLIMHDWDGNVIPFDGIAAPQLGMRPTSVSATVYAGSHWVMTPAIGLETQLPSRPAFGPAFQITYAPLADGQTVRAIVTGLDFDLQRGGRPISRTIMRDFRLVKRVNHAVLSPSRIMLGKNVSVVGDLGMLYDAVTFENGNPLISRSDFFGLDPALDSMINGFQASVEANDVDGDGRLRIGHPVEGPGTLIDTNGDGIPDTEMADLTGDGYLDEMDLFIARYDANSDGRVHIATEFSGIDDDLAYLLDSAMPDRNGNGVWGFFDLDGNGKWDPGEPLQDIDAYGIFADQRLGYLDGYIDGKDHYGKVRGTLAFRVRQQDWEAEQGLVAQHIRGPIATREGFAAATFDVSPEVMPELTGASFAASTQGLRDAASDGQAFHQQVGAQLGHGGPYNEYGPIGYDETGATGSGGPRYYRLDPDDDYDLLPDNWDAGAAITLADIGQPSPPPLPHGPYFERAPMNSPNTADWYYRPVYENMRFKDVQIPMGTNALFVNCTFVGVTWVRSDEDNGHPNWQLYGRLRFDPTSGRPRPVSERVVMTDPLAYPIDVLDAAAYPPYPPAAWFVLPDNPMTDALDKADFMSGTITGARPTNWGDLPDPIIRGGARRIINTKERSNNIRFHDCIFIGSVISDSPGVYTHVRNKLQFTGATRFVSEHPDPALAGDPQYQPDPEDVEEIEKSSMMLPGYSVDIGSFNSPPEQDVRLKGTIVAGVLDVRGNAHIRGSLLLTYRPVFGEPPLADLFGVPVGNPADFNVTLGYFGPEDGDEESLDPETLPIIDIAGVPTRIVGYDLDGDGLADTGPWDPPAGDPVPFHGYGRILIEFDPDMVLPDGIMLQVQTDRVVGTYAEGRP